MRETEIFQTGDFFKGSITIFGSNKNRNYAFEHTNSCRFNYNLDNENLIEFVNKAAAKILLEDPTAKFMFYLQNEISDYSYEVQKNSIPPKIYGICKNGKIVSSIETFLNSVYSIFKCLKFIF